MYYPEFSVTPKILKSVSRFEATKDVINVLSIPHNVSSALKREAVIKTCYHLTHFDSTNVTFADVKRFFDGYDINLPGKTLKEIENIKRILESIKGLGSVDIDFLKELHRKLLFEIAPANKIGLFRASVILSSQYILPPPPDEILAILTSFFSWFSSPEAKELPAPLRAAITYLEILKIHPFETENKKIAGIAALSTLYNEGYSLGETLSFESVFDESPTVFYTVLRFANNQTSDITRWLEYFLEGLAAESQKIKEKILTLIKDAKIRKLAGMIPLNDRQERIMEYLHDYSSMQNKDFERLFPDVSEDTILRDLKDLLNKSLISKYGSTKSSKYLLSEKKQA